MVDISDYIQDINHRIFLPGLQREFVWSKKQTANLFDSLIREYPVGMITRWDVAHSDADYFPYEFVQHFVDDERAVPEAITNGGYERYNNEVKTGSENPNISYLIIDGQQRLTSLFIGLLGQRIAYTKGTGGKLENIDHWSVSELCINLFGHPDYKGEYLSGDYEFKFRTTGEYHGNNQTGYVKSGDGTERFWFPLPSMMDTDRKVRNARELRNEVDAQIDNIDVDSDRRQTFKDIRSEVLPKIQSRILDAELPKKDVKKSSSEIKEIFQRINIEGESPDPYQLLLSRMMSSWPFIPPKEKQINPRRKTEKWVREFKKAHEPYEKKIGREIFMRYSMHLINNVLKTGPVTSLKEEKLVEMRDKWLKNQSNSKYDEIECQWFRDSLSNAIESLTTLGFSENTMSTTSMIAALGTFYYYNPNASPTETENLEQIYRFVSKLRLLKRSKGSIGRVEATRVTNFIHENIDKDYEKFPADDVFDYLDVEIAQETVENMVNEARYASGNTPRGQFTDWEVAAILNLSTPTFEHMNADNLEVDHIFPQSREDEIQNDSGVADENFSIHRLGNLQLLPESENREKSDQLPQDWIESLDDSQWDTYKRTNNYPDVYPNASNYDRFVEKRESLLVEKVVESIQ